jgi:DNA invertase Pin-like site-specific DNA recombinase
MFQQNAHQAVGAIHAAVMARVSTAEQARGDKTSLEDQIAKGKAEVAKRGWMVHDTYTDVFTGASSDRPELAQIIAAACEGTIQAVVFTKVDRLARDLRDLLNIEAQLARHGVAIVATDQPIDTSTPAGRLLFQQLGSFAEFERSMIRDRTVNGQRREAAKGRWPGGTPPYGFRLADGNLEHDLDEAKVVNLAAALLLEDGLTLTECADKLNADGWRPRKAPRWDVTVLRWMLSNQALAGTVVWAKPARTVQPDRPRRGHRTTGKYGGPIEIPVPAILERATFDRIQAVLAETAQDGRAENRVYMLSGRLTAPCERLYRGWWRNDRSRRLYRCAGYSEGCRCRTLHADDVERLVWDEIVRVLQEPERVTELARAWTKRVDGARIDTQMLDRRIASLRAALERAYTAGLTSGLDPEALQAATASIAADLATLRRERSTLKIAQANAAETRRRLVGLRELAVRLDTMSSLDRARLVQLLDVRARVTGFCETTDDWPYRFTLQVEGVIPLSAAGDPWDARTGGASAPPKVPVSHPAAAATR